jgi:hypothetical protein
MEIAVRVERLDVNRFRATSVVPAGMTAEGATRDEAVNRVEKLISEWFAQGELVTKQLPPNPTENPWVSVFGSLKDLGTHEELMAEVREYRRQVNADPNRL